MKYVALLRGINVGGNNKVDMKQLVAAMEADGFQGVSTYINSGNIFFRSNDAPNRLIAKLENLIHNEFGLDIRVLLRDEDNIQELVASIPTDWKNDADTKCDVMFLWEKYNDQSVLDELSIKPEIDNVSYCSGAILWRVDKKDASRSGMMKLVGTELYANMTIRNVNTVRKIHERLQ